MYLFILALRKAQIHFHGICAKKMQLNINMKKYLTNPDEGKYIESLANILSLCQDHERQES